MCVNCLIQEGEHCYCECDDNFLEKFTVDDEVIYYFCVKCFHYIQVEKNAKYI